jgi:hypothetical protein
MVATIVGQPYRAAQVSSPGEALGTTDVLVRVTRAGICGHPEQTMKIQLAFDA